MSVSPVGFAAAYARVRREPAEPAVLSDLLALVGYEASPELVRSWPLDRRVEAEVYATNVHLRASDNILRRCPRPAWMPEPWQGQNEGEGLFGGPTGTPLPPAVAEAST